MRVFKFGGASVKDAAGVKNVVQVLNQMGHQDTLLVISAMGKMTNAFEDVVSGYFAQPQTHLEAFHQVEDFHRNMVRDLFEGQHPEIEERVKDLLGQCRTFLENNRSPNNSFVYDQVVSFGELLSTSIVSAYLNHSGLDAAWI